MSALVWRNTSAFEWRNTTFFFWHDGVVALFKLMFVAFSISQAGISFEGKNVC